MYEQSHELWRRQGGSTFSYGGQDGEGYGYEGYDYGTYDDNPGFWWTPAGMALRYTIVGVLFAALLLFFVGGYFHARQRIRKGLPPLAYHRWMVARQHRHLDVERPVFQQPGQAYRMDYYEPPPPAYSAAAEPPPAYHPPEGAKVAPSQTYVRETPIAGAEGGTGPAPPPAAAPRY